MSSTPAPGDGIGATATEDAGVVVGLDVGDAQLAAELRADMEAVEALIAERLGSGEQFISDVALHLVSAGGKRFRPLMVLLTGRLGPEPDRDRLVRAAVVCEMIHLATLYHDDVMDEADVRRGVPSANNRWDNSVAILAGDFLFAHASMLLAELGSEAVSLMARTFAELVTGQMRETVGAGERDAAEHYLQVVWEKTGSLIATAAEFGAANSGADARATELLREFGSAVGIAFQIVDDIIDIASPTDDSGKTPGTDLREGVRTLPMLYALQPDSGDSDRLRELLQGPIDDEARLQEALTELRTSHGMDRTRQALREYVETATTRLDALPAGPANEALRRLVAYTVDRVG